MTTAAKIVSSNNYGYELFKPVEDIDDDTFMRIQERSYVSVSRRLAEHFQEYSLDPTDYNMAVIKNYPMRYGSDFLMVLRSLKAPFWYFAEAGDRVRIVRSGKVWEYEAERAMSLEQLNARLKPHGLVAEYDAGQDSAHVCVKPAVEYCNHNLSGKKEYRELSLCLPQEEFTAKLEEIIKSIGLAHSNSGEIRMHYYAISEGADVEYITRPIAVVAGDEVDLCVEHGSALIFEGKVTLHGVGRHTTIPGCVFKRGGMSNNSILHVTITRC